MKKGVLLFLSLILCASCSKETMSVYDEFAQKYKIHNPDGYDPGATWYEFVQTKTSFNFYESSESVESIQFTGYIDFLKDSFTGYLYDYEYKNELITSYENGDVAKTYVHECKKGTDYYKYSETISTDESQNKKETIRLDNADNSKGISIRFLAAGFYFTPYLYKTFSEHWKRPIEIEDNFVAISLGGAEGRNDMWRNKTVFYHNITYKLTEVVEYEENIHFDVTSSMSTYKISRLRKVSDKKIYLPKE